MTTPLQTTTNLAKQRFLFCGQVHTGKSVPMIGHQHLIVADVAGNIHRQLTKGAFDVDSYAVNPAGSNAYFVKVDRSGARLDEVCFAAINGQGNGLLYTAPGKGHHVSDLKLSPDGKQLAMVHSFDGANGASAYKRIAVLDLNTLKLRSAGRLDETSTGWDWHGSTDIRISLADPQPNVSATATVCVATGRGEISRSPLIAGVGGTVTSFGKGTSVVTRGAGDIALISAGQPERKVVISLAMQQRMGFIPDGISLSTLRERVHGRIVVHTASRQNEVTAFGVLDEKLAQIDYWFMSPGNTVFAPKVNVAVAWRHIETRGEFGTPAMDSGMQWMALNRTDRWTTIFRNQISVAGDKIIILG